MSNSNSSTTGIGLPGLVFVVFLVLKLTSVIDWSWWWVTAPLWAVIPIVILILIVKLILIAIAKRMAEKRFRNFKNRY